MARDKHKERFASRPASPLPPIESSPGFEPAPGAIALESLPLEEGPATFEVAEDSLPGVVDEVSAPVVLSEVAAPLAPTRGGVVCLVAPGQRYASGDLVELPQAEAERLACEGIVSFV
jgi:hypothetical protein